MITVIMPTSIGIANDYRFISRFRGIRGKVQNVRMYGSEGSQYLTMDNQNRHTHTLVCYMPYPIHDTPHLYTKVTQMDKDQFLCLVPNVDSLDTEADKLRSVPQYQVFVELWVWRKNKHGQLCQYRPGVAIIHLCDLLNQETIEGIKFKNVKGVEQADMTLTNLSSPPTVDEVPAQTRQGDESGAISVSSLHPERSQNKSGYKHYEDDPCLHLKEKHGLEPYCPAALTFAKHALKANVDGSHVPTWMLLVDNGQHDARCNEFFWINNYRESCLLLGLDPRSEELTLQDKSNILSQMIGYHSWACPYLPDETMDKDTHEMTSIDQFEMMRSAPCHEGRSGDCEDGGRDMLLAFMEIRASDHWQDPRLREIHEVAKTHYVPFAVESTIRAGDQSAMEAVESLFEGPPSDEKKDKIMSKDTYKRGGSIGFHVYVILVPWSRLTQYLRASGEEDLANQMPTPDNNEDLEILFNETSIRSVGGWLAQNNDLSVGYEHLLEAIKTTNGDLRHLIRIPNTREIMEDREFYRLNLSLASPVLYHEYGIARLIPTYKRHKFGCPMFRFMNGGEDVGLIRHGDPIVIGQSTCDLLRQEVESIRRKHHGLKLTQSEMVDLDTTTPYNGWSSKNEFLAFVRTCDITSAQLDQLTSMDGYHLVEKRKMTITSSLSLWRLLFTVNKDD